MISAHSKNGNFIAYVA